MSAAKLREAADALLEALSERREELLEEITAADHAGDEKSRHIHALVEERDNLEDRIASLEAERERLPMEAYRAGLDEEYEREDDLKDQYRKAGEELQENRERQRSVSEELKRLLPNEMGHPNDIEIAAFRDSVQTARRARDELEEIRERITKALATDVQPVVDAHATAKDQMVNWNTQREWQLAEKKKFGRTNQEAAAEAQERERLRQKPRTA